MRRFVVEAIAGLLACGMVLAPCASGYVADTTVSQSGGCPAFDLWNLSQAAPLDRQWSTSLSIAPQTVLTVAGQGTSAQLNEIAQAISDSFSAWTGVTGTTFNANAYPGLIAPLGEVSSADSCTNDAETNIDGLNTICFNQSSMGFTSGVLAFTRVITANAAGVSVGASATSSFAGQILDSDTLFRNDGQAMFATPAALATPAGQGAYDLESVLIHELGHWFGLDHSAVWRAIMFPYAPPPGQFLGDRPTSQAPDGPLADDDRTGVRALYPDPNDSVNVGAVRTRAALKSVCAGDVPGDFGGTVRYRNIRRASGRRKLVNGIGIRGIARGLELQSIELDPAVRRLIRYRASTGRKQLHDICGAARGSRAAIGLQQRAERLVRTKRHSM